MELHFNILSFDLLNLRSLPYGRLEFGYYSICIITYFIARCRLIAQMERLLLSRVM